MTVAAARDGIVTALETISGLRVYGWPNALATPPMCHVSLDSITYDESYGSGLTRYQFVARVLVGRADDRTAVTALDPYLVSVPAAIDTDAADSPTWCASARVSEARSYGVYEVAQAQLLGVEFVIDVIA